MAGPGRRVPGVAARRPRQGPRGVRDQPARDPRLPGPSAPPIRPPARGPYANPRAAGRQAALGGEVANPSRPRARDAAGFPASPHPPPRARPPRRGAVAASRPVGRPVAARQRLPLAEHGPRLRGVLRRGRPQPDGLLRAAGHPSRRRAAGGMRFSRGGVRAWDAGHPAFRPGSVAAGRMVEGQGRNARRTLAGFCLEAGIPAGRPGRARGHLPGRAGPLRLRTDRPGDEDS